MYTTEKILLKEYLHLNSVRPFLLFIFLLLCFNWHSVFAQDKKDLPSIFNNNDHYFFYRTDTIKSNDEIFQFPNPYGDTSFIIYSISKLWNEDTCGHKGYRINIANFLKAKINSGCLFLHEKDIIYHFGVPYNISEYKDNGFLESDNLTKIHVPELDVDFVILIYQITKDRECKNKKEFIEFRIDRKNDEVHSIHFTSDFFQTETYIER